MSTLNWQPIFSSENQIKQNNKKPCAYKKELHTCVE